MKVKLRNEKWELHRGNVELSKGGNVVTVEIVSTNLKFESFGVMCGMCDELALV